MDLQVHLNPKVRLPDICFFYSSPQIIPHSPSKPILTRPSRSQAHSQWLVFHSPTRNSPTPNLPSNHPEHQIPPNHIRPGSGRQNLPFFPIHAPQYSGGPVGCNAHANPFTLGSHIPIGIHGLSCALHPFPDR